jgi:hypothetical protein
VLNQPTVIPKLQPTTVPIPVTQVADAPTLGDRQQRQLETKIQPFLSPASLWHWWILMAPKTLSVTLSGMPEGSILSDGANNGDGSVDDPGCMPLATLTIRPPQHFSGTMTLTLTAYAFGIEWRDCHDVIEF